MPFFLYCNHYAFEGLFVLINRMTFLPKLSHFPIPEKILIQGNFALERKILLSYPIYLLKKGKKDLNVLKCISSKVFNECYPK